MKKILALTLALMLGASMAACGNSTNGNSSTEPSGNEVSSADENTASDTDAQEGSSIEKIKAAGKIYMCTNAAFPPFEYVDDAGNITGVDAEVAQAIADELGVELEIMDMHFDLLIDSVKSGKADFTAAGMTIKPDRLEQVDFSIEYVTSAQYVIVKSDSDITIDNLDGLTIAVQESTTGDFYTTDDINAKEVLRFKSGVEAGSALRTGKCDAVIIDQKPAETIAANSNGELKVLPTAVTDKESYAIAVKKGNQELLDVINSVLQKMIDEGKIDELVTKHMAES